MVNRLKKWESGIRRKIYSEREGKDVEKDDI